jgi:transcriptional regulator with XRE-family HTH domain
MDNRALGVELTALRLAAGLTQTVLADRMGTTQAAVARAEGGRLSPRMDFLDRWARACGLPLTLVLGQQQATPNAEMRRAITRDVFGKNNWNPYERKLTDVERRTLAAMGAQPGRSKQAASRGLARSA